MSRLKRGLSSSYLAGRFGRTARNIEPVKIINNSERFEALLTQTNPDYIPIESRSSTPLHQSSIDLARQSSASFCQFSTLSMPQTALVTPHSHGEQAADTSSGPPFEELFSTPPIVVGKGFYTKTLGGVLLVWHFPTRSHCVAKPVRDDPAAQSEIKILKELQKDRHPNIANMVDLFLYNGLQYITMENGGKNLEELLAEASGKLASDDIRMIMLQLMTVLAYLETVHIIHGDVKPDNLLFNGKLLKLCDWGLARKWGEAVAESLLMPVPYMPPEIMFDRYTKNVDIWSAGCTLAELVTDEKLISIPMIQYNRINQIKKRINWAAEKIEGYLGGSFKYLFVSMMEIDSLDNRITAEKVLKDYPCLVQIPENVVR